MKFIAISRGYYKDQRVPIGKQFDAPEDFKAKWAVPLDQYTPGEPKTPQQVAKEAVEGLKGVHPDTEVKAGDESLIPPAAEDKPTPKKKARKKTTKKKTGDGNG